MFIDVVVRSENFVECLAKIGGAASLIFCLRIFIFWYNNKQLSSKFSRLTVEELQSLKREVEELRSGESERNETQTLRKRHFTWGTHGGGRRLWHRQCSWTSRRRPLGAGSETTPS